MNGGFTLASIGVALGSRRVANDTLAAELGVPPGWIDERSGFTSRSVAVPGESSRVLGARAAREALARAGGARPAALVCATFTPDLLLCPMAPSIATDLGLPGTAAFDINAACAGGVVGVVVGTGLLQSGAFDSVLVVAADAISRHLAPEDRATRILFGDGAAALLLRRSANGCGSRIRGVLMGSDGDQVSAFHAGPLLPSPPEPSCVRMEGRQLYKFAVDRVPEVLAALLRDAGISPAEVGRVVLHQANPRMLRAIRERSEVPADRWVLNGVAVGNTVAASALISLAHTLEERPAARGEIMALLGFGAGLSWAAALLEW